MCSKILIISSSIDYHINNIIHYFGIIYIISKTFVVAVPKNSIDCLRNNQLKDKGLPPFPLTMHNDSLQFIMSFLRIVSNLNPLKNFIPNNFCFRVSKKTSGRWFPLGDKNYKCYYPLNQIDAISLLWEVPWQAS